jgi:hypothetical protein
METEFNKINSIILEAYCEILGGRSTNIGSWKKKLLHNFYQYVTK